jgi:hypothetical protein
MTIGRHFEIGSLSKDGWSALAARRPRVPAMGSGAQTALYRRCCLSRKRSFLEQTVRAAGMALSAAYIPRTKRRLQLPKRTDLRARPGCPAQST